MAKKTIIVFWLVALTLAPFHLADAQQSAKVAKIGFLGTRPASGTSSTSGGGVAFELTRHILRDLGYVEGKDIAFEYRNADNKLERLPPWLMSWSVSKLTCFSRPGRMKP